MLRLLRQIGDLVLGLDQLLIRVLAVSLGLGNLAVGVLNVAGDLLGRARHLGDGAAICWVWASCSAMSELASLEALFRCTARSCRA